MQDPKAIKRRRVIGKVVWKASGEPVKNTTVTVWDKDLGFDDAIGQAQTDDDGGVFFDYEAPTPSKPATIKAKVLHPKLNSWILFGPYEKLAGEPNEQVGAYVVELPGPLGLD